MTVQFVRRGVAWVSPGGRASSGLVRRLVRSHDDPAKRRRLTWLLALDDARLLRFGLTLEDIAMLRTTRAKRLTMLPAHVPPEQLPAVPATTGPSWRNLW